MLNVQRIEASRTQPLFEIPAIGSEPILPIQPIWNGASTIAPAAPKECAFSSLFRPTLAPPLENYLLPLIKLYVANESLANLEAVNCDRDIKISLDRVQELDRQKIEDLVKEAKDAQMKSNWSVFQTVAQYIASTSAIVLGLGLFSVAPVAGAFLIASGGLGLVNRAISDVGGWQWLASRFTQDNELQHQWAERIDSCLTYISTALAIFGAIGAYHAGALALISQTGRDAAMKKALDILATASAALQAVVRFGIAKQHLRIQNQKAKIKELITLSHLEREKIHPANDNLRRFIENSEAIGQVIKQAIAQI